jgi:hypothetical protein
MPKRFPEHFKVQVEGLDEWVNRDMSGTLYLLFGAVALLLAIGCGNVSILLLAQGTARQHEFAMRAARACKKSGQSLIRISRSFGRRSSLRWSLASYGTVAAALTWQAFCT